MTDLSAFLRAIIDEPDDDTHRLVFADWLDDDGRSEWASLIRLQCALHPLLVPSLDPFTDPRLLAVSHLAEPARSQVLACSNDLFSEADLHGSSDTFPRFSWKLRRGMLESCEVWGNNGVARFVGLAERLFATVPLSDLILRVYPTRDGILHYGSESPIKTQNLSRLLLLPQLPRLRTLDLRAVSLMPMNADDTQRSETLLAFAQRATSTRFLVAPYMGSDAFRTRLHELLGERLILANAHPDNPSDDIPF